MNPLYSQNPIFLKFTIFTKNQLFTKKRLYSRNPSFTKTTMFIKSTIYKILCIHKIRQLPTTIYETTLFQKYVKIDICSQMYNTWKLLYTKKKKKQKNVEDEKTAPRTISDIVERVGTWWDNCTVQPAKTPYSK